MASVRPDRVISFYRASYKPYGCFSNLYRRPLEFEGRVFLTSEHAYQYGKPRKDAVRDWLMATPSPALLAMAAHGLFSWDIAPGWSRTKVERMRLVLMAKFYQHTDLRDLLLGTGDFSLVERPTVADEAALFWGMVGDKGRNTLGRLLQDVRFKLGGERGTLIP